MKFINALYKIVETLICSNLNECAAFSQGNRGGSQSHKSTMDTFDI